MAKPQIKLVTVDKHFAALNLGEVATVCLERDKRSLNGNETALHTPTAAEQRGFAWARPSTRTHPREKNKKRSRLDRPTVGEASALPSFKVRLTKRKRSARFIQRRLLMVGRQKVLHMILPGAPGTLQLRFSTLLFILSTCPSPLLRAPHFLPPLLLTLSLSLPHYLSLHFTRLSLNRPRCSPKSPKTRKPRSQLLDSELRLPPGSVES